MRLLLLLCWAVVLAAVGATDTTARICEASGSKDLTSVRGPCPDGTAAKRIASVNIFDSLWVTSTGMVTCCNATGGPAVSKDAVAALEAAQQSNIRVFRFFASLFGAAGRMWVENPAVLLLEVAVECLLLLRQERRALDRHSRPHLAVALRLGAVGARVRS